MLVFTSYIVKRIRLAGGLFNIRSNITVGDGRQAGTPGATFSEKILSSRTISDKKVDLCVLFVYKYG
jgi:hypothetical protein